MKTLLKKLTIITLVAIAFAFLFNATVLNAFASNGIDWGINPNTKEQIPTAGYEAEKVLEENNGFFFHKTEEKKVYLTFDLGYEAGYTDEVLDILKANNIKAVFFLCSNYLKETELVNRMIADGHNIGNHTDKHKDLPKLNTEGVTKDITGFDEKFYEKHPDHKIHFFRPPSGRFDDKSLKIANERGLKTMMWSVAIVDWGKTPIDATKSSDKIASRVHPGAIILLHISNSGTPKMLEQLIPKLSAKGYSVGNYTDLLQ
ncbi:MAG: polysaccharide deacetylase family protein [Firmicutes bacterium]|nr:polysaccharide deacetylase family protein [Bacillota bacterium]MCL2256101.1 polysaccharide deacetylase family protein [Bacillota bacterium]